MHGYFLCFIHIMHVLYEHNILNNPKIIGSWFLRFERGCCDELNSCLEYKQAQFTLLTPNEFYVKCRYVLLLS